MSELKFKSADDFLSSLTRELVQRGTKSGKISAFRRAADAVPEGGVLMDAAIDLRTAYEDHRERRQGDASSTAASSVLGRMLAGARRNGGPIGALCGLAALTFLASGGWSTNPKVAATDVSPATGGQPLTMSNPFEASARTQTYAIRSPLMLDLMAESPVFSDRWAAIKRTLDKRIETHGSFDVAMFFREFSANPEDGKLANLELPVSVQEKLGESAGS